MGVGRFYLNIILKYHGHKIGQAQALELLTACCDLSWIVHKGKIPGVIWGPGPLGQAHQVNETLPLNEFEPVTRFT